MKLAPRSTPSDVTIEYGNKSITYKPLLEADQLLSQIANNHKITLASSPQKTAIKEFVTVDPRMLQIIEYAKLLSDHSFPVLILGETGTGKELLARIFHGNNNESSFVGRTTIITKNSFHPINCSGIVDTLFESLLFGHKKGSFTGADSTTTGLLRQAGEGTVFFDEVGDLPSEQQTKLLRVLQTRQVRGIGDSIEYGISCRFVFATNKNLKDMIDVGKFRADLYHRINKVVLRTIPLRDRPHDVGPIARRIAENLGIGDSYARDSVIPPECYREGNVRGIESFLIRYHILGMNEEEALVDI